MPAATTSKMARATTRSGALKAAFRNVTRVINFRLRTSGPSRCSLPSFGFRRKEQSTGITVSETTKDAPMLTIVAMAMGWNRRPSRPARPSSGTNTSTMSTVA
jgi:hypothetical protein